MERLTIPRLADILLNAPGWARVGLTVPNARMREQAADALAATIVDRLGLEVDERDRKTLPLPLPEPQGR
ncbi:DUF6771 family protein [Sphingomonas crocodyli]|uniref:Uncharacterized protein n=1 Tax=Sphingomonas crocodyli TaxID=1979270 RepID=A0A437M0Z1_9SPHN|nr:hypothetical protein EOD43_17475 [Sphingomonas crocodyli]